MQAIENDVFQGTPIQIKALLKAVGWTRFELARYVGVSTRIYTDPDGYTIRVSPTVQRWTAGVHVPSPASRERMLALVEMYRNEYVIALRTLINDPDGRIN